MNEKYVGKIKCCFCLSSHGEFQSTNLKLEKKLRHLWNCLDCIIRALEFGQGVYRILNFLLWSFPYFGSNFFGFFRAYKWLLFRCLHLPYNNRWLNINKKQTNKKNSFFKNCGQNANDFTVMVTDCMFVCVCVLYGCESIYRFFVFWVLCHMYFMTWKYSRIVWDDAMN